MIGLSELVIGIVGIRIADRVMPDYQAHAVSYHPEVTKAYAAETAREAILAGVLSLVVFGVYLWLMLAPFRRNTSP